MKKLLLPILLFLFGTSGGIAVAMFVFPASEPEEEITCAPETMEEGEALTTEAAGEDHDPAAEGEEEVATHEYAKLSNQFVVPVVENGKVAALVVLSLSVEVAVGSKDAVFAAEPKLRDVFLQVLFDHANIGGFEGNFTSSENMRVLRQSLGDAAQGALGELVSDVLIVDIVRQDV